MYEDEEVESPDDERQRYIDEFTKLAGPDPDAPRPPDDGGEAKDEPPAAAGGIDYERLAAVMRSSQPAQPQAPAEPEKPWEPPAFEDLRYQGKALDRFEDEETRNVFREAIEEHGRFAAQAALREARGMTVEAAQNAYQRAVVDARQQIEDHNYLTSKHSDVAALPQEFQVVVAQRAAQDPRFHQAQTRQARIDAFATVAREMQAALSGKTGSSSVRKTGGVRPGARSEAAPPRRSSSQGDQILDAIRAARPNR